MPELEQRVVPAAGTLCWRRTAAGGLLLLVVRSTRWDEWSWPKGRLDPGETLAECAVRETAEETGVTAVLGVPLPPSAYVMPDGRPKQVTYWTARVARESGGYRTDEIAETAWITPDEARHRIPRDTGPLDRLLELDRAGRLDAPRLLVVRHAQARKRDRWEGDEPERPLTRTGRLQARALVRLLRCWQPARLLSSPWERCTRTLRPYAEGTGQKLELVPGLTEAVHAADPEVTREGVRHLLREGADAAVCTHRPVLASVVGAIAGSGTDGITGRLPDADPWLTPAEILVVHHVRGAPFYLETHRPEPLRRPR